ncbi:hypothetical protein [Pseudomonas putida]|uniref:hypothetical protein n=1 Tax=Pseudomonas putida TaxID=303 RepID=UPI0039E1F043
MTIFCTTPKKITSDILALSRKINSDSQPQFIPFEECNLYLPSECFHNVDTHVESFGGRSVIGWQVWEWPGVFVEAEFHAAWETPEGNLVDITPKADQEKETLFIPDSSRKYEGAMVANIKHPIAKGEIVRDYIKLLDLGFILANKQVRANPVAQYYGSKLLSALETTKKMLHEGRTVKSRCVCGERSTYAECHRYEIKDTIEELTRVTAKLSE